MFRADGRCDCGTREGGCGGGQIGGVVDSGGGPEGWGGEGEREDTVELRVLVEGRRGGLWGLCFCLWDYERRRCAGRWKMNFLEPARGCLSSLLDETHVLKTRLCGEDFETHPMATERTTLYANMMAMRLSVVENEFREDVLAGRMRIHVLFYDVSDLHDHSCGGFRHTSGTTLVSL